MNSAIVRIIIQGFYLCKAKHFGHWVVWPCSQILDISSPKNTEQRQIIVFNTFSQGIQFFHTMHVFKDETKKIIKCEPIREINTKSVHFLPIMSFEGGRHGN